MAKVEKRLEAEELTARKQRNKDYQNRRQEGGVLKCVYLKLNKYTLSTRCSDTI